LNAIEHETQRFSKVWLIIDALDECPAHANENAREDFLQVIRKLPANLSLLITSRHRKQARCGLDPVDEVGIALREDDLKIYVRGQIRKHSAYNEELAKVGLKTITESISRNARGM
jgi:hypothetical protein